MDTLRLQAYIAAAKRQPNILLMIGLGLIALTPRPAYTQTFYLKDFDRNWYHYSYRNPEKGDIPELGQTRWGIKPKILSEVDPNTGKRIWFARLELHSYHPNDATHKFFQGTTILLNQPKPREYPNNGFELISQTNPKVTRDFEARMRFPIINGSPTIRTKGGIVPGFFPYTDTTGGGGKNEIDFELLHKLMAKQSGDQNRLWVNSYRNGADFLDTGHQDVQQRTVPTWNPSAWTRYKIKWAKDTEQWIVNDKLLFQVKYPAYPVPNPASKLKAFVNIWAPGKTWSAAADPNYLPATNPRPYHPTKNPHGDDVHYLDVEWVKVSKGVLVGGRK